MTPALDDLVGFFVNTLVLRTDVSGNPSFAELVDRVPRCRSRRVRPPGRAVRAAGGGAEPGAVARGHPLFQVLLTFQNVPRGTWELPGLAVRPAHAGDAGAAKFDLSFTVGERRDAGGAPLGLDGVIHYSADLFDPPTAESMAQRLVSLLDQVAADPGRRLGKSHLLQPAERRQVLTEWHGTARPEAAGGLAAEFSPRPPALRTRPPWCCGSNGLTFAEFDAAASRLAGPARHGGGPAGRKPGRPAHGLVGRPGGGHAGYPEGRRGLRAAGPCWRAGRWPSMIGDTTPAVLLADSGLRVREPDRAEAEKTGSRWP